MKFMISYFYQIRFFKPNMIPISTAMYDPKWFSGAPHQDKNGVWIGLNDSRFHPPMECECVTCNHGQNNSPDKCSFIRQYYELISKVDLDKVISDYKLLSQKLKIEDPIYVLIVHEVPSNPCSERSSLIRLFKEHGIELEEFNGKT